MLIILPGMCTLLAIAYGWYSLKKVKCADFMAITTLILGGLILISLIAITLLQLNYDKGLVDLHIAEFYHTKYLLNGHRKQDLKKAVNYSHAALKYDTHQYPHRYKTIASERLLIAKLEKSKYRAQYFVT